MSCRYTGNGRGACGETKKQLLSRGPEIWRKEFFTSEGQKGTLAFLCVNERASICRHLFIDFNFMDFALVVKTVRME